MTIRMVGKRMKIVKIPRGVLHLSLGHLDLGRSAGPLVLPQEQRGVDQFPCS